MNRVIVCRLCGEEKPNAGRGCCISCYKWERYRTDHEYRQRELDRTRAWRKRNREKINDYKRRRHEIVAAQENATHRAWCKKNNSRALEIASRYRQRHRDEINARRRERYRLNAALINEKLAQKRYAGKTDEEILTHPWVTGNKGAFRKRTMPQEWGWSLGQETGE